VVVFYVILGVVTSYRGVRVLELGVEVVVLLEDELVRSTHWWSRIKCWGCGEVES
jgi:hypothetical protein